MRVRNPRTVFAVLMSAALLLLPLAVLLLLGLYELADKNWLLYWLLGTLVSTIAGSVLFTAVSRRRIREAKRAAVGDGESISPEPHWGAEDLATWQKVLEISGEVAEGKRKISSADDVKLLGRDLVEVVSSSYYPGSSNPSLEVKLCDALIVLEQAVREVRCGYLQNIPFHNVFTIGDLLRVRSTFDVGSSLFSLYRVVRAVSNPFASLLGELRDVFSRRAAKKMSGDAGLWILARFTETAGKHLINLYSGQVVESGAVLRGNAIGEKPEAAESAALRILLLGQTGVGKSSLINAIFGEMRSPVGVLPETAELLVFEKHIPGVGRVEVIDSPGYGEPGGASAGKEMGDFASRLRRTRALEQVDVVVLVVAATNAAREADRLASRTVRALAADLPRESVPPLFAVLTKIDLLRPFRRWNPPYNLLDPEQQEDAEDREKARNIAGAVYAAAQDIELAPEQIIPMSLSPEHPPYNADLFELVLAEVLPEARRLLLRRLIKNYRDAQYWKDIRQSLEKSGAFLLKSSFNAAIEGIKRITKTVDDIAPKQR